MQIAIRAALALLVGLAAAVSAMAQDYVVTGSTADGLSPGLMLKSDAALSLGAGERLELFGPSGAVVISGPYDGALSAAAGGGDGNDVLAGLMQRRERIRKIGAARGDDAAAEEAATFNILTDQTYCVGAGSPPRLFAPPADEPRVISLRGDNALAEIYWPAGADAADWPADAPFRAGLVYRVSIGDVELPGGVSLVPAPAASSPSEKFAALIGAGCFAQAEAELTSAANAQ